MMHDVLFLRRQLKLHKTRAYTPADRDIIYYVHVVSGRLCDV